MYVWVKSSDHFLLATAAAEATGGGLIGCLTIGWNQHSLDVHWTSGLDQESVHFGRRKTDRIPVS